MNRWATILTFIAGFILAFGATAVCGYLGQNPIWLWMLFIAFGFWIWSLPTLKGLDPKLTTIAGYGFPFMFLWLASNPEPAGTMKTFVYQMVLAGVALAALISLIGLIGIYRRSPDLKPVFGALVPFLVCAWLVAFFSSSTGAASHMIDFLMSTFGLKQADAHTVILILRKSLHFLFYGTVGFCGYRLAVRGGALNKAVLLGLLIVLVHASFDEIRQSSYADRTGSFWDVCLDMAGGTAFVLVAARKRAGISKAPS